MTSDNKCEHEACRCAKAPDSDYCSPYCETAKDADVIEPLCGCGHAGCRVQTQSERIAS